MLRYEEVCQDFLDAAENSGLVIFGVRHFLDVITCDREFRCTCVHEESQPPYQIRAEVGFTWEAMLTAESNYGDDYPLSRETLFTRGVLCDRVMPESFIELEIRVYFEALKFEEAGVLARRIQTLISNLIEHDNQPQIKYEVSILPEGRVVIHDSYIYYCWPVRLQEEMIDFTPICEEIRKILEVLVNSSLFG